MRAATTKQRALPLFTPVPSYHARELAKIGARKRKSAWVKHRNAVARQIRSELGLPPAAALISKGS